VNADLHRWLGLTVAALDEAQARYAVVGGLAVGVRADPRFTHDVDLAVSVADDSQAEAILFVMIRNGYRTLAELDQTTTGRLATMRLVPPGSRVVDIEAAKPMVVDLLFSSSGIEPETVAAATLFPLTPMLKVPVAQSPHLLAMKLLSVSENRPKDVLDLHALVKVVDDEELAITRRLLTLMRRRGYSRGEDLEGRLEQYLRFR
jgi:predicted nucleotidyltransferase